MNAAQIIQQLKEENKNLKAVRQSLRDEIRHLRGAIRALNRFDQDLHESDPDSGVLSLIRHILQSALLAVSSESGSLLLLDTDTDELVFVAVAGPKETALTGYRMPAEEGIVGWAIKNRQPTLVPSVQENPRWFSKVDKQVGFETQSLLCVPVIHGEKILGAIEVVNKMGEDPFQYEDLEFLLLVARLSGIALAEAEEITE